MLPAWLIITVSLAYLGTLFAVAHYADRRAEQGRSIVANPTVYSLSLAVYATSWTFFGSVGFAATAGAGYLPIYLGPTLMIALGWVVLRKMIRISRANRITSLADFVSSRYGKSTLLGALVTVIAVVGIVPYIALQLKAISTTFVVLTDGPFADRPEPASLLDDHALYVAVVLAAFAILFGTRKLDAAERHEGMVAAIAVESVVKLLAFLAIGLFVTFGVFGGFGDLFDRAASVPETAQLFTLAPGMSPGEWVWLIVLSMLAFLFLPRQFQVAVVENVDERHLDRAMWLFPLYLLAINLFVLPIALGGLLQFGAGVNADTFVLALPLAEGQDALALVAFIGGLSAATGMVIVETVALSTMVSNSLVMPVLLRRRSSILNRPSLPRLVLAIRRLAIVLVLLLGYAYFRAAGEGPALVSIGLVSFAAVAQLAPAVIGGMYWKGATRGGAVAGLTVGFAAWAYMLLLPAFARSGWLPSGILETGPFGIEALRPTEFLGLGALDEIGHAMFWSLLLNVALYVGVSLEGRESAAEHGQAAVFVDAFRREGAGAHFWRGSAPIRALDGVLARTLGADGARQALAERGHPRPTDEQADAELVHHVETLLAGAVGPASARTMISSAVEEEPLGLSEVMEMLDETIEHSRELQLKSGELEAATAELRAANERLRELDRLKDDFVSTVTHELRTPLTSIRSFSEIVYDNPELEEAQRRQFLQVVINESERLSRLINQVLDLSKLESGSAKWRLGPVDLPQVVVEAVAATEQLVRDHDIALHLDVAGTVHAVHADRDRVMQVLLNLLANATKFCDRRAGRIDVRLVASPDTVRIDVLDNGGGVRPEDRLTIFEKFYQVGDTLTDRPTGTGLGLPISREIITRLGGRLWVEDAPGGGAKFSFTLPRARVAESAPPAAGAPARSGA
jgi:Na+/proline symporter/nitrogen-specific signal transduction histidine kinase